MDLKANPRSMGAPYVEARDLGNLLEKARQSATSLPDAPLIVLTGPKGRSAGEQRSLQESGHFVQWDDPDAVIQAVKDVLEAQVSRPASSHP